MSPSSTCPHSTIHLEPSSNADHVGYKPFSIQQLFTAATGSRKRLRPENRDLYTSHTFPAPLVLPGDDLAGDPKYPPQSFKSWLGEEVRNEVTKNRRIIYVATAPQINADVKDVASGWDLPNSRSMKGRYLVAAPAFSETLNYLQAFFHGIPVKQLPSHQQFTKWTPQKPLSGKHKDSWKQGVIHLRSEGSSLMSSIKVRCPNEIESRSPYSAQLNLNDILDHAMAILPADAYCLLMLVRHDLYEDEQDDFCCGRAYGGSRIAVVSTAQYQPALDSWHGLSLREGHFWPGSHCKDFIEGEGEEEKEKEKEEEQKAGRNVQLKPKILAKRSRGPTERQVASNQISIPLEDNIVDCVQNIQSSTGKDDASNSPVEAALRSHLSNLPRSKFSRNDLESIYLRRVTLTAAHELLHCFGLDHCVYRACAMQGTASILEDSRQPPYLCCVCENKLARAVADVSTLSNSTQDRKSSKLGWWEAEEIMEWKKSRQEQILRFCERQGLSDIAFGPMVAWTRGYLNILKTLSTGHNENHREMPLRMPPEPSRSINDGS